MELPNRRSICRWFKEWGWHWRNQEIKTTRQVMVLLCSFPKDIIVLHRLPSPVRKEDQESQPSFHSGSVHGEFSNQCSQRMMIFWLSTRWVEVCMPQYGSSWHASLRVSGHGARLIQRHLVFRHFLGVLSDYGITWEWVTQRIINPGKLLPRSLEKVGSPTTHVEDNYPPSWLVRNQSWHRCKWSGYVHCAIWDDILLWQDKKC